MRHHWGRDPQRTSFYYNDPPRATCHASSSPQPMPQTLATNTARPPRGGRQCASIEYVTRTRSAPGILLPHEIISGARTVTGNKFILDCQITWLPGNILVLITTQIERNSAQARWFWNHCGFIPEKTNGAEFIHYTNLFAGHPLKRSCSIHVSIGNSPGHEHGWPIPYGPFRTKDNNNIMLIDRWHRWVHCFLMHRARQSTPEREYFFFTRCIICTHENWRWILYLSTFNVAPAREPHRGALPRFGTKACRLRERAPACPQKSRGAAHPEASAPLFPV